MTKIKLFFTTFILLLLIAAPISAKSLLTHFDTVVIEDITENSRESVLGSVIIDSEISKESFTVHSESANSHSSGIRDIIKASSSTFFQK